MLHIILAEGGESLVEQGVLGTVGYGTFHQQTDAIAYETAYVIDGMLWHVMGAQRKIDGRCQVT